MSEGKAGQLLTEANLSQGRRNQGTNHWTKTLGAMVRNDGRFEAATCSSE